MNEAAHDKDANIDALLEELEPAIGDGEVTEKMFFIQEQKAGLMDELQAGLRQLSEEGTVGMEGKMRKVTHDESTGELQIYGRGGELETVTRGQLMVSGLWGESYFLDASVPYDVKKHYLVKSTHYRIADLYDHQIALFEKGQDYNVGTGFGKAYTAIAAGHESGTEKHAGLMAEKMVESLITKLSYDYNLPYRLKSATAYEDVEYKIDFIIEPNSSDDALGVGVEAQKGLPDIAIQFTINNSELTLERKKRQVTRAKKNIEREDSLRVKDLILIALPLDHVYEVYNEWKNAKHNKRAPGGADELWDDTTKEKVFKGILGKVFDEEKTGEMWSEIRRDAVDLDFVA